MTGDWNENRKFYQILIDKIGGLWNTFFIVCNKSIVEPLGSPWVVGILARLDGITLVSGKKCPETGNRETSGQSSVRICAYKQNYRLPSLKYLGIPLPRRSTVSWERRGLDPPRRNTRVDPPANPTRWFSSTGNELMD